MNRSGVTEAAQRALRRLFVAMLVGVACAPIGAVHADENAAAAQPADADTKDKGSELVCRREQVMGSNIKKRVCRTRAQIDAERHVSQEAMSDISRSPTRSEGGG